MNTPEIFYINKLRSEVAFQQALKGWQPTPHKEEVECPRCQSKDLAKLGRRENGNRRYKCRSCQRGFAQKPCFKCDCLIPGGQLKCQDCVEFMQFMAQVKQIADSLRGLSREELQRLL